MAFNSGSKKILIALFGVLFVVGSIFYFGNGFEKREVVEETEKIVSVKLNETGEALNVSVTPLEVLEDSRCPVDVVCIQAGTVRLRTLLSSGLGSGEQVFELNQIVTTEAEKVILISVKPIPISTEIIKEESYEFIFKIERRF